VTRPIVELVAAVAVMLAGAWLIGWWAVGIVLVLLGALAAADAVLRDDDGHRRRGDVDVNPVIERWRRAP